MIEVIIRNFCEARLGLPVYMEFPEDPPDRFVVLRKGGSGRVDFLDSAMMVADSYAESLYEAACLNERVKACLDALPELPQVSGAHLSTDYPAYDTNNKRYRYQAVYSITHY